MTTNVWLGIAIALYFYIIVDRICKAIESKAYNTMMAIVYSKLSPDQIEKLATKIKEK